MTGNLVDKNKSPGLFPVLVLLATLGLLLALLDDVLAVQRVAVLPGHVAYLPYHILTHEFRGKRESTV